VNDTAKPKARLRTKSYPGSISKRGGTWRVRLCVGGKYSSHTVTGTKVDAQNFATAKHAELSKDGARACDGLPVGVTFSALIKDFEAVVLPELTAGARRSYANSFKPFRTFFVEQRGDPLVRTIRRAHIKLFFAWRRTYRVGDETGKGAVSQHTVRRDARVLHRLFNHAMDMEYIDANPCHRLKPRKADEREAPILDDAQLEALLTAAKANPMLAFYILLLAETGVRSDSEALPLRWEDFDVASGFVRITSAPSRRTKSGKSRSVPMTARLKAAFQEHAARFRMMTYKGARSPFVFHHVISTRTAVGGQQIRSITGSFNRAAIAAKMPEGFRRHDLRHRRVTTWLAEGQSPAHVQEAVGHADIQTTMGYYSSDRTPNHLRALVEPRPAPASATGTR
jgi:integrase